MEELINSQKNILGISDFLQSASKYIEKNFPNFEMDSIFTSAINGSISTNFWTTSVLDLARQRNKKCDRNNDHSFNCYHNS